MASATVTLSDIAPQRTYIGAEHSFICGLNGSGKTVLERSLLERHRFAAVHDGKGSLRWKGWTRITKLNAVVKSKAERIIYSPDRRELKDPVAQNAFFEWNYQRAKETNGKVKGDAYCHLALGVDELTAGPTKRLEILPSLMDCVTRAREYRLYCYLTTQRPRMIPQVVISEARNVYVFYLVLDTDREKIATSIPLSEERIAALDDHEFFFYRARTVLGPMRLAASAVKGSAA